MSLGNRTTHRNLCPLASSPAASSAVCTVDSVPPLPKHTYRTEPSGCSSSHRMQPCSADVSENGRTNGPTAVSCSMASKVVEAEVDQEVVDRVGTVLDGLYEVGSAAREDDGLREVAAVAGGGSSELRGVEQRAQRHEARGVEHVSWQAEVLGHGQRRRAEHVGEEDDGGGGGGEEGNEQGAEVRERAVDDGEDEGDDMGVGGEVVEGHLRERGGGDDRREGGQGGGVGGRGEVGVGDDGGGEAVERGEARGELGHRGDVPHAGAGEHHDVRGMMHLCCCHLG
nr:unnamed protein product [Digitaria exilis]